MNTETAANVHYMARQPILDAEEQTFGYELLYRSAPESFANFSDSNVASHEVLEQTLMLGCRELSGGKRLFINCTGDVLVRDHITVLPPDNVVVEILECVEPTEAVIDACRRLKSAGFIIALDDFVPGPNNLPLVPYADIIKVDFRNTTEAQRAKIVHDHCRHARPLAEKVETRKEYKAAQQSGFTLFQGYFFCEPVLLAHRDLLPMRINHLRLIEQTARPEVDFGHLEEVIKADPALCYRLLRYLNSYAFCLRTRITSVRHALTLLGELQVKRWVAVACVSVAAEGSSPSSLSSALLRGRLGELIASSVNCRPYDLFLTGLFSMMHTFLGVTMQRVLERVQLPPDTAAALLGKPGRLGKALELIIAYERADWEIVRQTCRELHLSSTELASDYWHAVQWVDGIMSMNMEVPAPELATPIPATPGNGLRPM